MATIAVQQLIARIKVYRAFNSSKRSLYPAAHGDPPNDGRGDSDDTQRSGAEEVECTARRLRAYRQRQESLAQPRQLPGGLAS